MFWFLLLLFLNFFIFVFVLVLVYFALFALLIFMLTSLSTLQMHTFININPPVSVVNSHPLNTNCSSAVDACHMPHGARYNADFIIHQTWHWQSTAQLAAFNLQSHTQHTTPSLFNCCFCWLTF